MIIQKLKKILSSICFGVIVIFSSIGAYNVYRYFKPVEVVNTETQKIRIKLESIGVIKVAESEQNIKRDLIKGKSKFFQKRKSFNLDYKCFYEYDLKDIEILSEINEKEVIMEIDANKLFLSDLILINDESYCVSTLISPIIEDSEIIKVEKELKVEALEAFKNDKEFKELAINSLKEKLYNLASDLGFEKINIIVKER